MPTEIGHLFEHPEHIRTVATWIHAEFWSDKPGYGVETFERLLGQASDPDRIPLSLLALADGAPAGTVNLVHSDSESRPHLHPWLAALFVLPAFRHRGVGRQLCLRLLSEARRLGIPELFLGTDIPGFYAALGAEPYEQVSDTMCIMRFRTCGRMTPPGDHDERSAAANT